MDELTLEDLQEFTVEVTPVTLLGKRAYLRAMTFDGMMNLNQRYQGKDVDNMDATPEDLRFMLANLLCDKEGNPLFTNIEQGTKLLARLNGNELSELINVANESNGDIESEKKHLSLTSG